MRPEIAALARAADNVLTEILAQKEKRQAVAQPQSSPIIITERERKQHNCLELDTVLDLLVESNNYGDICYTTDTDDCFVWDGQEWKCVTKIEVPGVIRPLGIISATEIGKVRYGKPLKIHFD